MRQHALEDGPQIVISTESAEAAIAALKQDPLELIPSRGLLSEGLRLSIELDHPAYDRIFAALAIRQDCPLVTADSEFASKAARLPLEIVGLKAAAR